MHQLKLFKIVILLVGLSLVSASSKCQSKQKWKIVKVVNTFLQLGVADPIKVDMNYAIKTSVGKTIYLTNSMLFFPKSFKRAEGFADTVFIKEQKTFKVKADNQETLRYPGDELGCREVDGTCFVGKSFMKLLGSKDSTMTFFNLRSNAPDFYSYKLCIIKKNKRMGLLSDNGFLLFIIEKQDGH